MKGSRAGVVTVTIALAEAPGVIRESIRTVLNAHRYVVLADVDGELAELGPERFERLLREFGNNVAQALFAIAIGRET